jgi:hypothetical protein
VDGWAGVGSAWRPSLEIQYIGVLIFAGPDSVSALEVGGPEGHREDVSLGKGMRQDLLL